jgi:choline-phosphate cytidylyltransferase
MAEFRDSIKANWATTGQELSKDIRQFWQSSRPASPARTPTREVADQLDAHGATARSPTALSRLSHLDIPSRGTGARESSDFAAGYNLGLIGGVRSWVRQAFGAGIRAQHANVSTDGAQSSQPQRQQA